MLSPPLQIPRTLFLKICEVAEVSRGAQVPGPEKKVFAPADCPQMYTRVLPTNFFAFGSELKNNVVDRFIDNHIFSECQELTSDLKVARPVDEKIDSPLKTFKIFFVPKIWHPILLRVATRSVRGLQLRSNF